MAGCPHPDCAGGKTFLPTAGDVERLLAAVEAGDLDAPGALLRKYPGSVVRNRERHALQLRVPCDGDGFIGHLPLDPAQDEHLMTE